MVVAPPDELLCPISREVMSDPVVAADGHTYERMNIDRWLRNRDTSPMTNLRLDHKRFIPNHALRAAVAGWVDRLAALMPPVETIDPGVLEADASERTRRAVDLINQVVTKLTADDKMRRFGQLVKHLLITGDAAPAPDGSLGRQLLDALAFMENADGGSARLDDLFKRASELLPEGSPQWDALRKWCHALLKSLQANWAAIESRTELGRDDQLALTLSLVRSLAHGLATSEAIPVPPMVGQAPMRVTGHALDFTMSDANICIERYVVHRRALDAGGADASEMELLGMNFPMPQRIVLDISELGFRVDDLTYVVKGVATYRGRADLVGSGGTCVVEVTLDPSQATPTITGLHVRELTFKSISLTSRVSSMNVMAHQVISAVGSSAGLVHALEGAFASTVQSVLQSIMTLNQVVADAPDSINGVRAREEEPNERRVSRRTSEAQVARQGAAGLAGAAAAGVVGIVSPAAALVADGLATPAGSIAARVTIGVISPTAATVLSVAQGASMAAETVRFGAGIGCIMGLLSGDPAGGAAAGGAAATVPALLVGGATKVASSLLFYAARRAIFG